MGGVFWLIKKLNENKVLDKRYKWYDTLLCVEYEQTKRKQQ